VQAIEAKDHHKEGGGDDQEEGRRLPAFPARRRIACREKSPITVTPPSPSGWIAASGNSGLRGGASSRGEGEQEPVDPGDDQFDSVVRRTQTASAGGRAAGPWSPSFVMSRAVIRAADPSDPPGRFRHTLNASRKGHLARAFGKSSLATRANFRAAGAPPCRRRSSPPEEGELDDRQHRKK